jgi:hypothetical protein
MLNGAPTVPVSGGDPLLSDPRGQRRWPPPQNENGNAP